MAERKTDLYRLVMEVTTTEADPAKWNWETILDLGGDESVRIVDSQRIKERFERWQVVTYDLWADGEGGLTVNDKYRSGVVHLLADDNDRTMMQAICDLVGGDPDKLHVDQNTDNTGGTIYILDENGNPACELVREVK
jgi:hypothetical protein